MYSQLSPAEIVFLLSIAVYTLVTAWTDLRTRRIPNKVTVTMFVCGLIWQTAFHGTSGLLTGLAGFAVGFGLFFVLWMIGTAGGGDVKLLGGLGVWLGAWLTLKVIMASLIFVVLGTFAVVVYSVFTRGWRRTRNQYKRGDGSRSETLDSRRKRRVMAFALPVALATWSALALFPADWQHRNGPESVQSPAETAETNG